MAFPDLFKLEKLTITPFAVAARQTASGRAFEAMFNPTTLRRSYGIQYHPECANNGTVQAAHFERMLSSRLSLQLLLDGTGVNEIGVLSLFGADTSVTAQIKAFLAATYTVIDSTHQPAFLIIHWGDFGKVEDMEDGFRCRMASAKIAYTSFNRDGSPLRAQIDADFVGDDDISRQLAALNMNSPDVTHSRVVRAGDTLPAMTRAIYGDSRHMVEVARANGLGTLRTIEPGSELVFPPIERGGR